MQTIELVNRINDFEVSEGYSKCFNAIESRKEFLKQFPFRSQPGSIDGLELEMIYNPHSGDHEYFFNWIEHKLMWLGAVALGSAKPWENARENAGTFRDLLKIAVDDKISIANKIDAHWEDIKGFGGDRHVAKKILSVYYPEDIIPIFKTEDWESLLDLLGIDYTERFIDKFKKNYAGSKSTKGEKFETLNELLMEFKNSWPEFAKMDNAMFMNFLYFVYGEQIRKVRGGENLE